MERRDDLLLKTCFLGTVKLAGTLMHGQNNSAVMLAAILANATALPAPHTLDNGVVRVDLDTRGVRAITLQNSPINVTADGWSLSIARSTNEVINCSSAKLSTPKVSAANATHYVLAYRCTPSLAVSLAYALEEKQSFVSKRLSLRWSGATTTLNVSSLTLFDGVGLRRESAPFTDSHVSSSLYGLGDYAAFCRWSAGTSRVGALVTAQNPYLHLAAGGGLVSLRYAPNVAWRAAAGGAGFAADAALLGAHVLTGRTLQPPADPLDVAEQAAMVEAIRAAAAAPLPLISGRTTKVHVGWCENDYQLDIARAADRTEYKRIIDRAAQFGVSHMLFAPRNSDVSCRANNTDAWG